MKTLVLGEPPPVLASLILERQRLGLDTHDEIWDGDYHMSPAPSRRHADIVGQLHLFLGFRARTLGLRNTSDFNLGVSGNFRVPDLGFFRDRGQEVWVATAAIVVEVRSPDDESYQKFDFYFERGVEEILIVDLVTQDVQWFARGESEFESTEASLLLGFSNADIAEALEW